ncbi:MAG: PEP/pyruvate-binding domain-containing protein [Candidatus Uhrbacteria bacterium]
MKFLKTFSELNKTNAPIAGGKGASLGEMTNAGIPVPPGFVVLSAAFEKFLEETDLNIEIDSILETVKHEDINTVEQASEKIQALILAAKMPEDIAGLIQKYFQELGTEFVAVRSSATAEDSASAAWAGQLDSFLNTTEKDLLEKVKKCWASLFTPRAIFYRFEQNLHTQKISVAVVIQKMVVSEVSGIAFSVHPVTQDYNQLIIEAGFGLGEAIVSGQITPDSYVVEKEPRRIIDKNVAEQTRGIFRATGGGDEWRDIPSAQGNEQKISNDQILELANIILGIENHYGFPCDIEWAYENGKFYIVQSRPITTLVKKEDEIKKEISDENWTKVWTTEYSLFSVWMFGRSYADICWQEVGVGFSKIIFLIEGSLATVFRLDKEQKEFAKKMASRFLFEEKFLDKAVKLLSDIQTEFEKFFETPEQEALTPEKWSRFLEIHRLYQPYFLGVLWAPNELENFNVPTNLYEKIFAVCESTRKRSESVFPLLEKFLQKLFKFIAAKEKINENFLRAILPEEFTAYINGQGLPDEKILKSRYDYSAVLATKDKNELLLNIEARQLIERIAKINTEGINEIRGTVANQGIVTGKARLVFMEQDLNKVQVGDIIVTTMTRPEWVSVMKFAGAYVTDAGSVLCHAAIVSREFNKPCIISTKIATKVLHDGDLIEVDADSGIVKIIKLAFFRAACCAAPCPLN